MAAMVEYKNVEKAVNAIMAEFSSPREMGEAVVAIRVVGEFSSGKTRFLREIFRDQIQEPLLPVSSMEKQTILPLELTFGEEQRLELIRREEDDSTAEILKTFNKFPLREELEQQDLTDLRLRLFLPEQRLTLAQGDGYYEDSGPQTLRIIDEPGWNSEDEERGFEALGLSQEWENLSLICVCRATRLDSQTNQANLKLFLEALRDGDMQAARDRLPLLFVITDCPKENRERSIRKQYARIADILGADADNFPLKIIATDFDNLDSGELDLIRQEFWQHILSEAPSPPLNHDFKSSIAAWPEQWQLYPYIERCRTWLANVKEHVLRLRPQGKFMGGRSMHYFAGLDNAAMRSKAINDWEKRIRAQEILTSLPEPPDLPADHPLRPWLQAYWLPRLRAAKEDIRVFVAKERQVLGQLSVEVQDLENWLGTYLDANYHKLLNSPEQSFLLLMQLCEKMTDLDTGTYVATVLASSLIEARYAQARELYAA